MRKIIFIGFNKTGTTTIHNVMSKNGFDSVHCAGVRRFKNRYNRICKVIRRRDVVCDWGDTHIEVNTLEKLSNEFENELFVLNTRSLKNWIKSRLKHYLTRKRWDFDNREFSLTDVSLENAKMFLQQRTIFYENVARIFCDKGNLLILDIDDVFFYDYISREVGKSIEYTGDRKNERALYEMSDESIFKINEVLSELFAEWDGVLIDTKLTHDFSINKRLLKFKNNI